MSSDIVSTLQLDKNFGETRVIVAKELRGCDSTFITSCVLGHVIKNKSPTLLVCLHNSLTHYHNVGLRMFYNVKKTCDAGSLLVYDLGSENVNNLLQGKVFDKKIIIGNVKEKIKQLSNSNTSSVNVIVDGLSHMFDLGFSLSEINMFCKEIINEVQTLNNSFVLFQCSVSGDDDVTSIMANQLSYMAYTVLELDVLSSGWSAEVSGHLSLSHPGRKFEKEHFGILDGQAVQYHFKLFDKGVKLFAPGAV